MASRGLAYEATSQGGIVLSGLLGIMLGIYFLYFVTMDSNFLQASADKRKEVKGLYTEATEPGSCGPIFQRENSVFSFVFSTVLVRDCVCNEFNGCVFNGGARRRLLWTHLEIFWPGGGGSEDHAKSQSFATLPSALVKKIHTVLGNKFLVHWANVT